MSESDFAIPPPGQRVITKKVIPTWIIVIIIILVILLILIPIGVWLLARGSGARGGAGDTCADNNDCATGLTCSAGICAVADCIKPDKADDIAHNATPSGFSWDVELTWDEANNADFYIIFVGEDSGFDPFEEAVFVGISGNNEFLLEGVPQLADVYIIVLSTNQACGAGLLSDEYHFATGALI